MAANNPERSSALAGSARHESLSARQHEPFAEYDRPPDEPFTLLRRWFARAAEVGVREPKAFALATATAQGRSSSRVVVISRFEERALVFASHSTSKKGRELASNPWVSGVFYWRETGQQISLAGPVTELEPWERDELWFARPIAMHALSVASQQSEPLLDREGLRAEAERLSFPLVALPRPARFTGYRIEPSEVEFWCPSPDRMHKRLRFERTEAGWGHARLQP